MRGVLQDEHVGDASIEGKLKELLARAQELKSTGIFPNGTMLDGAAGQLLSDVNDTSAAEAGSVLR
jgi:hypothetical protein